MNDINFRHIVAKNLVYYRKLNKLTQVQLAEKINYSDKAVSKWETGESLPDVEILKVIANLYGIKLDALVSDYDEMSKKVVIFYNINKIIVPLISVTIVFLVASLLYVSFNWWNVPFIEINNIPFYELFYLFAIPISLIILLVFSVKWWGYIGNTVIISLLIWTLVLAIFFTIDNVSSFNIQSELIFIVAGILQIATIIWFLIRPILKIFSIKKI